MAITGTMTARRLPRNRKMTMVTISSASTRVLMTSRMEVLMKKVESYTISPVSPAGSCERMSEKAARTRWATSRIFASGATLMPMKTERTPLKATLKS